MNIEQMNTSLTSEEMSRYVYHLMNDKFGLPDHKHDYKKIMSELKEKLKQSDTVFMGIYNNEGELCGTFGVLDMVPGHDGNFFMMVWDKCAVSPSTVKFVRNFLDYMAGTYDLRRLTAQTPCEKLCRILRLAGFKTEGRFRHGYKWNGKFYTLYQLRKLKEG